MTRSKKVTAVARLLIKHLGMNDLIAVGVAQVIVEKLLDPNTDMEEIRHTISEVLENESA